MPINQTTDVIISQTTTPTAQMVSNPNPQMASKNQLLGFSKFKKALLIGLLSGILVTTSILTYWISQRPDPTGTANNENPMFQYTPIPVPTDYSEVNVLLLGYGGPGHAGGFLSDVIQVVHIDFDKEKIALISIPRDLWVTLPTGLQSKINAGLTVGTDGLETSRTMAEIVTGLPIEHVIGTDFVNFKRIVGNVLDGIEVDVPETLDDPWYPITGKEQELCDKTPEETTQLTQELSGFELEKQFECRYTHVYFEKGLHKMEGEEALQFVRSRHGSAAGDFSRSQRQHALLQAIKDKFLEKEMLGEIVTHFKSLADHTRTNLSLEDAKTIAPILLNATAFPISSVVISTDNVLTSGTSATGQYILLPKAGQNQWESVREFIKQEID